MSQKSGAYIVVKEGTWCAARIVLEVRHNASMRSPLLTVSVQFFTGRVLAFQRPRSGKAASHARNTNAGNAPGTPPMLGGCCSGVGHVLERGARIA